MRFSTAIVGLLFGWEVAALRTGTRSVSDIEVEVRVPLLRRSIDMYMWRQVEHEQDKCAWVY